ncbi:hypothetical protein AB836_01600 [Rickettsiales bacterium (ex Bugula neritina AB1)]|nr:hypothetical protein AB836_01600 [Rickettsiales bacterium (ex Bugula neritina AB1)]
MFIFFIDFCSIIYPYMERKEKIHCKSCNTRFIVNKLEMTINCIKCKKNIKIINNNNNKNNNSHKILTNSQVIPKENFLDMFKDHI